MRRALVLLAALIAVLPGAPAVAGDSPPPVVLVGAVAPLSPSAAWVEVSTSAGYGSFCYGSSAPPPPCFHASTTLYAVSSSGRSWKPLLHVSSRPFVAQNGLPTTWMQPHAGRYGYFLAWAPGPNGMLTRDALYRTPDGGRSWTRLPLPFKLGYVSPTDVAVSGSAIWVLAHLGAAMGSEEVVVYRSLDAGSHWRRVTCTAGISNPGPGGCVSPSGIAFGGHKDTIAFLDSHTGFIDNNNFSGVPFLHVTRDGGVHWSMQQLPLPRGVSRANGAEPYMTLGQAHTFGPTVVIPAWGSICHSGRPNTKSSTVCRNVLYALVSHDAGRTWPVPAAFPLAPRDSTQQAVWDIVGPRLWYVATPVSLWVTRDAGAHWTSLRVRIPSGRRLLSLELTGPNAGWAVAGRFNPSDGVVSATTLVRTDDGGRTWSIAPRP